LDVYNGRPGNGSAVGGLKAVDQVFVMGATLDSKMAVWTPRLGRPPMASSISLGECTGDCDSDADCTSDLTCFQRSGYSAVPGCAGKSAADYDFYVGPVPACLFCGRMSTKGVDEQMLSVLNKKSSYFVARIRKT